MEWNEALAVIDGTGSDWVVPYTDMFSKGCFWSVIAKAVEVEETDGIFPGAEFVELWNLHGISLVHMRCLTGEQMLDKQTLVCHATTPTKILGTPVLLSR